VIALPRRDEHKRLTRLLLGDDFEEVHRWKDEPWRRLGVKHRIERHGLLSAFEVALKTYLETGDIEYAKKSALASIIHDIQDGFSTMVKMFIGCFRDNSYKKRKRKKRHR